MHLIYRVARIYHANVAVEEGGSMHGVGALGIGNLKKSHGQGHGHGRLTRGYSICGCCGGRICGGRICGGWTGGGWICGGANLWPGLQQAGLQPFCT